MFNALMPAALEHMQEARNIRADISVRMVQRIADARLRSEVNDPLRLLLGEGRLDDSPVGEVGPYETKALPPLKLGKPGLFQRHIIIRVEVVEPDHVVPAIKQASRRVIANKAGGAGN